MDKALLEKYFKGECSKEEVSYIFSCIDSGKLDDYIARKIIDFNATYKEEEVNEDQKSELLMKIHDLIHMEELVESLDDQESVSREGMLGEHPRKKKAEVQYQMSVSRGNQTRREGSFKKSLYLAAASISLIFMVWALATQFNNLNFDSEIAASDLVKKETLQGQKLTVHLSDGTVVKLNSGSTIHYPKEFDGNERIVDITGEAFFEVAHDKDRPFIVRSSNIETTVLGTSFNFRSFPDVDIYNVALVTGKLMVNVVANKAQVKGAENLILNPGEIADLNVQSGQLNKSVFDVEEFTAWKDGIIYFKDADHKKVIRTLENWFGVKITTVGSPQKEWNFTSKIEKETLKNILEIIKASQDIEYNLRGTEVEIIF